MSNVGIYEKSTGQYIPSTALGAPDFICCIEGRYVGIEVKTPKGTQSEHQKQFQTNLAAANGIYFLVRSLDEAIEAIEDAKSRLARTSKL